MRSMLRLGPLLIAALAAIAGCSDDDGGEGGFRPLPQPTVELASPEITLGMLQHAYEARDSVTTARVYDESYAGASTDLNDPPGSQTVTFSRADEIRHVGALAKSMSITGVTCDLGPPAGPQHRRDEPQKGHIEHDDQVPGGHLRGQRIRRRKRWHRARRACA